MVMLMGDNNNNKAEAGSSTKAFYTAFLLALIAISIKTIQIVLFYDPLSGLVSKNFSSSGLGLLATLIVAITFLINLKITLNLKEDEKPVKIGSIMLFVFAMVVTAICFIIQGIVGLIIHTKDYSHKLKELRFDDINASISFSERMPELLYLFTDIACIICALVFVTIALKTFKSRKLNSQYFFLIPVVWGAISLICTVIEISNRVSVQSNVSKVLSSIFALIFLLYIFLISIKSNATKKFSIILMSISFGSILLALTLPYAIAFVFGVRDIDFNIPIFAYIGLSLLSIDLYIETSI